MFVFGMPRSGTKLLRELLNNHSRIAITPAESNIIPFFSRRSDVWGDLRSRGGFRRFYTEFSRTIFFQRLAALGYAPGEDEWFQATEGAGLGGILQAYYAGYAAANGKTICGDKTPSYLLHLPLLSRLFPSARFIHIVRDVRDQCLSSNRAWGKSLYRGAQRWTDSIGACRADVARTGLHARYIEVRYEALIEKPEAEIRRLCDFLSVGFEADMVDLKRPAEYVGDARGAVHVVGGNSGKWKSVLGKHQVERIERIAGNRLEELGYLTSTGNPGSERVGRGMLLLYKLSDGLGLFRFYRMRFAGPISALRFMAQRYRHRATRR